MPRPPHNEFQPSRQVETIIPTHALSANATERLQYLSTPKRRPEGPFREPEWAVSVVLLLVSYSQQLPMTFLLIRNHMFK